MAYCVTKSAGMLSLRLIFAIRADTLFAGLHLVKCLAQTQGPKVRVNAILPGLLLTEWVCPADRCQNLGSYRYRAIISLQIKFKWPKTRHT